MSRNPLEVRKQMLTRHVDSCIIAVVPEDASHAVDSFAARLNDLWLHLYPTELGRPYTLREAADLLNTMNIDVTHAYLGMLRSGERTNPKMTYIIGLARLFGVPEAYFFDASVAADIRNQITELAAIRDTIRSSASAAQTPNLQLAARADGLSPRSLQAILALIDQARAMEGLPPATPKRSSKKDRRHG
jgi:transcriptional regulator with XRE-family HTH domain